MSEPYSFCGSREPHKAHEFLDDARRRACPGVRYTPPLEDIARRRRIHAICDAARDEDLVPEDVLKPIRAFADSLMTGPPPVSEGDPF